MGDKRKEFTLTCFVFNPHVYPLGRLIIFAFIFCETVSAETLIFLICWHKLLIGNWYVHLIVCFYFLTPYFVFPSQEWCFVLTWMINYVSKKQWVYLFLVHKSTWLVLHMHLSIEKKQVHASIIFHAGFASEWVMRTRSNDLTTFKKGHDHGFQQGGSNLR